MIPHVCGMGSIRIALMHVLLALFLIAGTAVPQTYSPAQSKTKEVKKPGSHPAQVQPNPTMKQPVPPGADVYVGAKSAKPVRVHLDADRREVQIGERVTFTISLDTPTNNAAARFILNYDDENQDVVRLDQAKMTHSFQRAGSFNVVLTVGLYEGAKFAGLIRDLRDSLTIRVDSSPPPVTPQTMEGGETVPPPAVDTVFLEADKTNISRGDRVVFTAYTRREFKGLIHVFHFGDRSKPEKVASYTVTHEYRDTGTFTASVEAADKQHRLVGTSVTVVIQEPPPPPPRIWVYIVAAAILVFIGYKLLKPLVSPRPTFRLISDYGQPRVGGSTPLHVTFEIHLKHEIEGGRYSVKEMNGSLVKKGRRSHG